jgi:class 3 adenylate cyclase
LPSETGSDQEGIASVSGDPFLESFVPAVLAGRIGLPDGPLVPADTRFDAVILVADISGFTALAERFAQRGAEGAELLTAALNEYFSTQLEILAAHGGAATKFAGDSTIPW